MFAEAFDFLSAEADCSSQVSEIFACLPHRAKKSIVGRNVSLVSISASNRGKRENNMAFLYSYRVNLSSFVVGHESHVKR